MAYLKEHLEIRLDVQKLLPGARAVICVADVYAGPEAYEGPGKDAALTPRGAGEARLARYGLGRDYHKVIKKRLHRLVDDLTAAHPNEQFRTTTDTAPIFERDFAVAAGLGWIGKHTLVLDRRIGSWFLLGCVVTTLDLQATPAASLTPDPPATVPMPEGCGTCTRCIDACPTDAIAATPGAIALNATRCISYLTLEHRGPIDTALQPDMGRWIGGCDVCQEVCPFNGGPIDVPVNPAYAPAPQRIDLQLVDILGWDESDRATILMGSALKRMKLWMLHRNALIAAGNALGAEEGNGESNHEVGGMSDHESMPQAEARALRRAIERHLSSSHPVVAQTAREVTERLAARGT